MFKTEFNQNIFRMFTGTSLGTLITFASMPILTRLYSQEDFGNFQLLLSIVVLFASIGSLKYEVAIVLPKDKKKSDEIATLSFLLLAFTTAIFALLFIVLGDTILTLLNASALNNFVFFIIIGIFFTGFYQVTENIVVKNKQFNVLSNNKIFKSLITNGGGITAALIKPTFTGLYSSQLLSNIIVSLTNIYKSKFKLVKMSKEKITNLFKEYKKFALFNTPLVFINTYSLQLPIFLITFYFGAGTVGLYMIADRLLITPLNVIGQSFQKVYLKEASDAHYKGKGELLKVYKSTVKKLSLIGLAPLIIVFVAAPFAVDLVLGDEWREAGVYMQILMIGFYFRFINSPISSTFSIINKQEIGLIIIIFSLLLRWGAMVMFSQTIYSMLIALTISTSIFYIMYNAVIFYYIKKGDIS